MTSASEGPFPASYRVFRAALGFWHQWSWWTASFLAAEETFRANSIHQSKQLHWLAWRTEITSWKQEWLYNLTPGWWRVGLSQEWQQRAVPRPTSIRWSPRHRVCWSETCRGSAAATDPVSLAFSVLEQWCSNIFTSAKKWVQTVLVGWGLCSKEPSGRCLTQAWSSSWTWSHLSVLPTGDAFWKNLTHYKPSALQFHSMRWVTAPAKRGCKLRAEVLRVLCVWTSPGWGAWRTACLFCRQHYLVLDLGEKQLVS